MQTDTFKLRLERDTRRPATIVVRQAVVPEGTSGWKWPRSQHSRAGLSYSVLRTCVVLLALSRSQHQLLPENCLPQVLSLPPRLLIVVCFGRFGSVVSRSQVRGTISVEEHPSMAPRPRRQSQNPPLQKSSVIPALPWLSKPRLRYSPGLAPTTRLNALLNAASDS
jgi:hypothetical protein